MLEIDWWYVWVIFLQLKELPRFSLHKLYNSYKLQLKELKFYINGVGLLYYIKQDYSQV